MFPPQLSHIANRLASFKDWPEELEMKPEELAEAGFYHSPHDKDADLVFMKNNIQLNNDYDCDDAYKIIIF